MMYQLFSRLFPVLSLLALFAPLPAISAPVSAGLAKRAPNWGFPYGSTKVRGVNLGGWLVLEVSSSFSLLLRLRQFVRR